MPNYLTRESFLQVDDINTREVTLPGSDCVVRVKTLKAAEASLYNKTAKDEELDSVQRAVLMCAWAMVDENGERLFDPNSKSDRKLLSTKSLASIMAVFRKANELAEGSALEVDKKEKNSETTQEDSSPSSSAST
jgi:hypothetical protein